MPTKSTGSIHLNRVEYRSYTLTQTVGRIRGARVSGGQADVTAVTRCLPLPVLPLTAGTVTTHVLCGVTVLARQSAVACRITPIYSEAQKCHPRIQT